MNVHDVDEMLTFAQPLNMKTLISFVPPVRIERTTYGLGNRCSIH